MKSVIKKNSFIRKLIRKEMIKRKFTLSNVQKTSRRYSVNISCAELSRYLNNNKGNNLSEKQILWLCHKLKINVYIGVNDKIFHA